MRKAEEHLGDRLRSIAERTRRLLATLGTREAVSYARVLLDLGPPEASQRYGLGSPYRQSMHMLGLLLTTPEPDGPSELTDAKRSELNSLLRAASDSYLYLLTPSERELESMDEKRRLRYAASAPAFMHHFFTGTLASPEQFAERIRGYLVPFDDELEELVGISASDALAVAEFLVEFLQDKMDRMFVELKRMKEIHSAFVAGELSFEQVMEMAEDTGPLPDPLMIDWEPIAQHFGGEQVEAFREAYEIKRGSVAEYTFFTERNPLDIRPVIFADEEHSRCPLLNEVFKGVLTQSSQALGESESEREGFFRTRDLWLEDQIAQVLRTGFGDQIELHRGLAETATGQYEHDLILREGGEILVIETKASSLREPFRNVEKAFQRLRADFRGSIQKGYEQAMRVVRPIQQGRDVTLYDQSGSVALELTAGSVRKAWPVVITEESYGVLATDLSLLLDRKKDDPFPWVAHIDDLEAFAEGLKLKGWDVGRLFDYVAERSALHGSVLCTDELELAGMYLRQGQMPEVPEETVVQIDPEYSDVFDQIYIWRHGGEAPDLETKGDIELHDATEQVRALAKRVTVGREWLDWPPGVSTDVPRNDPCPCGSGRKFKRCHGRPEIQFNAEDVDN